MLDTPARSTTNERKQQYFSIGQESPGVQEGSIIGVSSSEDHNEEAEVNICRKKWLMAGFGRDIVQEAIAMNKFVELMRWTGTR